MRVNCADVKTMAGTNLHVKNRGVPAPPLLRLSAPLSSISLAPPPPPHFSILSGSRQRGPDLSVRGTKYVKHLRRRRLYVRRMLLCIHVYMRHVCAEGRPRCARRPSCLNDSRLAINCVGALFGDLEFRCWALCFALRDGGRVWSGGRG